MTRGPDPRARPGSRDETMGSVTAGILYAGPMNTFILIIVGLLMLATLGVLFAGMIGMAMGVSGATANRLMRYRVIFQGAAVALLMLFMSMLRS